ncbi:MAG: phage terminase large subunit family protein [Methylococcaceae bacterium]
MSHDLNTWIDIELRTRRENSVEDDKPLIAPETTFLQWCEQLAAGGMLVDGHPFRLDNRPALRWIYEQIPSTSEEAHKKTLILQKSAQVGFTVLEILATLYMGIKFAPSQIGMYLPDRTLAGVKSSERFMPVIRTIPQVYKMLMNSAGHGEGNILIRNVGKSRFYFLWTSGAMTESVPLDIVSFDEVQEMTIGDMEKTKERMSASRIRYTMMGSTANYEDMDIHYWYKRGTQHQFHTLCPHCNESMILDEHFPDCIRYDEKEYQYRYACANCDGWIDDPQRGEWIAKEPEAIFKSIHFPQMLSPTISPREIIESYFNATDLKNFYNRKLGKPYTDPSQVPINMAMLNACVEEGRKFGVEWKNRGSGMFMAIDQMGCFNVVLIAERLPSGHMAIVHAEEIYHADPFARCTELMANFGVAVCVLEQLPNFNDAHRFAKLPAHDGRVFLVNYSDMPDDWIRWGDAVVSKADRKTSDEDRIRYTVTIDQYRAMQMAFAKIQQKICLFPDADGLIQEIQDKGVKKLVSVLRERVFFHFTRTALIAAKDDEQHKYRRKVVKVGVDPHFAYCFMMLNVAWARAHGTSSFILPEPKTKMSNIEITMPGLPKNLVEIINAPLTETCGSCSAYNKVRGKCDHRNLLVRPKDPACLYYVGVS